MSCCWDIRCVQVRRHTAEQVYLELIAVQADEVVEDDGDVSAVVEHKEGGRPQDETCLLQEQHQSVATGTSACAPSEQPDGRHCATTSSHIATAAPMCPHDIANMCAELPAERLEGAMGILTDVRWDGEQEGALVARQELAAMLGWQVPRTLVVGRKAPASSTRASGTASMTAGEGGIHSSYQTLLDDAARGMGY
jgi:hypothetical protein